MGLLAPIFLAGLAALSLPLIFHLVRRTPRGRQEFSTLMFLSPTPPRLTRRSRLDQILLLLLRLGALGLLAFAFTRPFLRESAMLTLTDLSSRRVAILVDTSASLRRGDLWQQAVREAEKQIDDLGPRDDVALYGFNDRLDRVIDFEKEGGVAPEAKAEIVRARLKEMQPGWGSTDLAAALMAVASDLERSADVQQSQAEPQIVLISDYQKGSETSTLQGFEWPERVRVIPRPVTLKGGANASVRLLADLDDSEDATPRVRITNAADSAGDQFYVNWSDGKAPAKSDGAAAVFVPPGQSRVVKLPRDETNVQMDRVRLLGDDHDFDNEFFVVPPRKETVRLLSIGAEPADDANGPLYYLSLAVGDDALRKVEIVPAQSVAEIDPSASKLLIVTSAFPDEWRDAIRTFVERGGTLFLAPVTREAAAVIPTFLDDVTLEEPSEPSAGKYLLLGQIDFAHPLFAPFSNPKYSDFTKIHIWNAWPLTQKETASSRVLSRFDNGRPAILERVLGDGRIIVLATNWRPKDSQLALSTKFVPLIGGLLDEAFGSADPPPVIAVNEPMSLPESISQSSTVVHKPDAKDVRLAAGSTSFGETDHPGVYSAEAGTSDFRFAVNVAAAESDTAPVDPQFLEQFGVKFGRDVTTSKRLESMRQQRDTELESRQKVWQWIIVAVLAILGLETWWASRATRQAFQPAELAA